MYSESAIRDFQKRIWHFYALHRRDMPWRKMDGAAYDPYKIWISEVMLQQTQVSRVMPKYEAFMQVFPTVVDLAKAPLSEVLRAWSGLGYNRRAKFLHAAAQQVVRQHAGIFPRTHADLVALPGIGSNTAGAIMAYAYNYPAVFIETNIRSVMIMYFFESQEEVTDTQIREAVTATLDHKNPREWYWALMDYGSYLKTTAGNHARRAKNYTKQSKFEGSVRKIRGQVLRALLDGPVNLTDLQLAVDDKRLLQVLDTLIGEQMISYDGSQYSLPEALPLQPQA